MPEPLLQLSGITKVYPSVVANDGIDLTVRAGEIHAILGENGAGKSTLVKIIYGVNAPDGGEIRWEGRPVEISSPAQAREMGIGMVFQHFSLFETLTVAQNVSLAVPGSLAEISERIRDAAEQFGLDVNPDVLVQSLTVGERQRVEILRCILQEPKLLVLDEPTSVLPPQGIARLFKTLKALAAKGYGIIFISHKLDEIRELCDRATILRRGRVTGHVDPREETNASLTRMMIGRDVPVVDTGRMREDAEVVLSLDGLSYRPADPFATPLDNVTLSLRAGEILGIAGVSGNGQHTLSALLSGEERAETADAIRLSGEPIGTLGPAERRKRGLQLIPEERLGRGAVPPMSLSENAALTGYDSGLSRRGFLNFGAMKRFADDVIRDYDVHCGGPPSAARSLSGGNLQKYIVGREITLKPRALIVSQPTWGVDVGAAGAIRQRLADLKAEGVAVLVISEELSELMEISDEIQVMFRGRLSPPVRRDRTTTEEIGLAMTGDFAALGQGAAAHV